MKSFLGLMICFLVISGCNIFSSEPTGTEFPVDFRGSWLNETIDEIEGDVGFIFTEKEIIYWNHNGPDDEPANCYFTFNFGELISYKGNKYTLIIQPIFNDEPTEETISIQMKNGKLEMTTPDDPAKAIFSKLDMEMEDFNPACPVD